MGLLDFLGDGSVEDPRMAASLALAQGLMQGGRRSGAAGLLDGMQGYVGTMAAAREAERRRQLQEREMAMQEQLRAAQMREYRAQAQQREEQAHALQAQAQRAAQFRASLAQSGTTSPAQALAAGGGPTPGNAAMVGAPRTPDWFGLALNNPEQADLIEKLSKAPNFGVSKVARTIEGQDEAGRPVTYQVDDYGRRVGAPTRQWKAPVEVGLGGSKGFIDPVTRDILARFQVTESPDALLSATTARRGQDMQDRRSGDANEIQRQAQRTQVVVDPLRGPMLIDKGTSTATPATMNGQPIPGTEALKATRHADQLLGAIGMARDLLGTRPTQSYAGAGVDLAGRLVGATPAGAEAAGRLETLSGWMTANVPRMEGPQSNYDVINYQQMAARVGDRTLPVKQRLAALGTLETLQRKYSALNAQFGGRSAEPDQPAEDGAGWSITPVGGR